MPLNLTNVVCGGAKDIGKSYLANPIYTAILIVMIIFMILIWHYWKFCGVWHHIVMLVYAFIGVSIVLICHNETINAHYNEKYRNKAADDLTEALTNKREQDLMSTLMDRQQITPLNIINTNPQPTINPAVNEGVPNA